MSQTARTAIWRLAVLEDWLKKLPQLTFDIRHKFSMGLASGLLASQSKTWISFFLSHLMAIWPNVVKRDLQTRLQYKESKRCPICPDKLQC